MNILLGSASDSVRERWKSMLANGNQVQESRTASDLQKQATSGVFELIMLHRLMIDSTICSELRKIAPSSRLFLLSDQPDHEEGLAFLKLGIVGYANTYIAPERLAEALNVIKSGRVWVGQKVIQHLILEAQTGRSEKDETAQNAQLSLLSPTERQVSSLIARGLTNLEIADELGIVERTVKAHLTAIYAKLRIGNRLSLALLVNRSGS